MAFRDSQHADQCVAGSAVSVSSRPASLAFAAAIRHHLAHETM
ncbi:hypothetical protein I552_9307 [Mycobacterium xenopi 3993]|nr:hypothetical protein I552_9307 [Mycobacterium xenopi 3993]